MVGLAVNLRIEETLRTSAPAGCLWSFRLLPGGYLAALAKTRPSCQQHEFGCQDQVDHKPGFMP